MVVAQNTQRFVTDAFDFEDTQFVMGAMLFLSPFFGFDGYISTAIVCEGAEDSGDTAAFEAFFDGEI